DQAAFAELVDRHGTMVLNVCKRILHDDHAAEDAMQAVFLVLARKAGSGHWHDSLASWLHETAQRTALKARTARQRLQQRERQATPMPPSELTTDLHWRELRAVLDDELTRLPHKYRAPLVLCYLEGKSNEEAAQALGWTKGTVSGRLARARDLLRARLSRRGLAFGAGAVVELMSQHSVEARVTPALAASTVQTATLFAAGSAASSVSTQLAEGVLHTMFVARIKMVAVVTLALGCLAGAGFLISKNLPGSPEVVAAAVVVDPAPAKLEQKDVQSKPKTVADAEFVLDTQRLWQAPPDRQTATLKIGLTITNRAQAARSFLPWPGEIVLRTPDGKEIVPESRGLRGLRRRLAYEPIEPGKSQRFSEPVLLRNESGSLSLEWSRVNSERMAITNLKPGRYLVAIKYVQQAAGGPLWAGQVETEPLAIDILPPGAVQSKPLVKDGLAFQVETVNPWRFDVLDPKEQARRQPTIPLALRVTNDSKDPRSFIPWRGEPVLKKPDGTLLPKKEHGRNGLRKRPDPVTLQPGESHIAPEAVTLTRNGTSLSYMDITGTYCTLDGIAPGKYLLCLNYEIVGGDNIWVGSVQTEPVEIIIEDGSRVGAIGLGRFSE
ncbi:MAG: RNA polymerase sigma factor, partial [Gemmataceae bacterium]